MAALSGIAAPMVADLTQDDSVAAMAARTLAAAPPRFTLAALSMGGYVAFEILRQAPERVSRLGLLDTSAAPDSPARAAQRRAAMESLRLGRFAGVTTRMLPQLVHPRHVGGEVGAEVRAMTARVGPEAFLRQQQAILGRPDSRPLLGAIAVPTLVAVGDADVLTPPAEAIEIHHGIRGSSFHLFQDCGHLPPLETPDEVSNTLRCWLLGGDPVGSRQA
jgi:pimeloyl-ACP methyl ester carboxylesterase